MFVTRMRFPSLRERDRAGGGKESVPRTSHVPLPFPMCPSSRARVLPTPKPWLPGSQQISAPAVAGVWADLKSPSNGSRDAGSWTTARGGPFMLPGVWPVRKVLPFFPQLALAEAVDDEAWHNSIKGWGQTTNSDKKLPPITRTYVTASISLTATFTLAKHVTIIVGHHQVFQL